MRGLAALAFVMACTPTSSQDGTKPTPGASMTPAATVAAIASPHVSPSAVSDSCRVDKDCPGLPAKIEGVFPPEIPQRCCFQPGGADGSPGHLGCQPANSKRPCASAP